MTEAVKPQESEKTQEVPVGTSRRACLGPLIEKSLVDRMPQPTGWRVLVLPYKGKSKDRWRHLSSIKLFSRTEISTQVGYVLKIGPLAYKDEVKFPTGFWCKEGDWVIFARYAGSRFKIEGGEVRILNDDEVLATILDPEDILHN